MKSTLEKFLSGSSKQKHSFVQIARQLKLTYVEHAVRVAVQNSRFCSLKFTVEDLLHEKASSDDIVVDRQRMIDKRTEKFIEISVRGHEYFRFVFSSFLHGTHGDSILPERERVIVSVDSMARASVT